MESLVFSCFSATAVSESIVASDNVSTPGEFIEQSPAIVTTGANLIPYPLELNLTRHQRSKLAGVPPEGIKCYLHHWLQMSKHHVEGIFCDAAWDEIYCWPPTRAGENASQLCSEVMKQDPEVLYPEKILGSAFRICGENGTWEWNGWTNYNQCLAGLDIFKASAAADPDFVLANTVRYIFFVGSIISIVCILISLLVFYYFNDIRSLNCDRITIQVHLMLSLLLRFILMIIITEPFIFQRATHYRTIGWICKAVMTLQLYATAASVAWMFVQGHLLNSKVTTHVFDREAPLRTYFGIGWGTPLLLVLLWAWVMEANHQTYCWKSYSKLGYIWIIVGPMILALMVNLLFLVNILRILLTKVSRTSVSSDCLQLRRAVKALIVLFPLLGVNNLLFMYNPGGEFEAAYMITNATLQASQGIVVATLYCFLNEDVREAIRRKYRRSYIKRSALIRTPSNELVTMVLPKRQRRRRVSVGGQSATFGANGRNLSVRICGQATGTTREHNLYRKESWFSQARGSYGSTRTMRKGANNPACWSHQDITVSSYIATGACERHAWRGLTRTTSV